MKKGTKNKSGDTIISAFLLDTFLPMLLCGEGDCTTETKKDYIKH